MKKIILTILVIICVCGGTTTAFAAEEATAATPSDDGLIVEQVEFKPPVRYGGSCVFQKIIAPDGEAKELSLRLRVMTSVDIDIRMYGEDGEVIRQITKRVYPFVGYHYYVSPEVRIVEVTMSGPVIVNVN